MRHQLVKPLFILSIWLFAACNGNIERLDTTKFKDEIDNRKVKKISDSDITLSVNSRGSEITKILASKNCDEISIKLDSLNSVLAFSLESVDLSNYKPEIEKEKELIEAVKYSLENGEDFKSTYQELSNNSYVIYFPLSNINCDEVFAKADSLSVGRLSFKKADIIRSL